ncbi:unnamed protein product [Trichobilharzia regenti]|nr:unnamed protein product [Trichobilharzia regenti]
MKYLSFNDYITCFKWFYFLFCFFLSHLFCRRLRDTLQVCDRIVICLFIAASYTPW